MNLNRNTLKWIDKVLKRFEKSGKIRFLVWSIVGVVYLFGAAALINAIKWW